MFFHVHGLVEVIVDEMVFGWLFADVLVWWWHANQMNLMERGAFGTNPRVLCVFLAVVEDLASDGVVSVVSGRSAVASELWLSEKDCQLIRLFLLLEFVLELFSLFLCQLLLALLLMGMLLLLRELTWLRRLSVVGLLDGNIFFFFLAVLVAGGWSLLLLLLNWLLHLLSSTEVLVICRSWLQILLGLIYRPDRELSGLHLLTGCNGCQRQHEEKWNL